MIKYYLELRKYGYGVKRSLSISLEEMVKDFLPIGGRAYKEQEFDIGRAVNELESLPDDQLDFQSIEDIAYATDIHQAKGYLTTAETNLVFLHLRYCQNKELFSKKLTEKYLSILKKLPDKFNEILGPIEQEGKEGLKKYCATEKAARYKKLRELGYNIPNQKRKTY